MARQSIFRQLSVADLGFVSYAGAWDLQKRLFQERKQGSVPDSLLLLEHPNTYTLGKTAHKENLVGSEQFLRENNISVFEIDRGGDITYHGPGQLVGYPIINLTEWQQDAHKYLRALEEVLINVCAAYGLTAGRIEGLTGVWIDNRKIAAIGIKISSWVTMHGFAFNVNTNLGMFSGIIPCGITDKPVTSLKQELGREVAMDGFKQEVISQFTRVFGYQGVNRFPVDFLTGALQPGVALKGV